MKHFSAWPTTGAILWIGQPSSPLEKTETYQFAFHLLCQECDRSAALLKAHSHPDLFILSPKDDSRWIKIDQVRELIEWSIGTPQIASRKIAIITPAEALNLQAANALLKTLEESSENTIFILVTPRPQALPATVISRCHLIRSRETIQNSLSLINSEQTTQPGQTEQIVSTLRNDLIALSSGKKDPISLAAEWIKQDLLLILDALIIIFSEVISNIMLSDKHPLSKSNHIHPNHSNCSKEGHSFSEDELRLSKQKKINQLRAVFNGLDETTQSKRILLENVSVNTQLLMENLLINYVKSLESYEIQTL